MSIRLNFGYTQAEKKRLAGKVANLVQRVTENNLFLEELSAYIREEFDLYPNPDYLKNAQDLHRAICEQL